MTKKPTHEELEQKIKDLEKESADCRLAMEALQENEERFELILKSTNDGIWDWDAKKNKAYTSGRFKELIGLNEDADGFPVTWEDWASLIHPDDRSRVLREFQEHLEKTRPYDIEYRYRHADGQYRWYSSRGIALFDDEGKVYRIAGSTRDINDRKLAEEKLQKSEEKYRSLVEITSDRVWETDQNGIFTYADPKTKTFLGYEPEEIIGKAFNCLMIENEAERVQSYFKDKIEPFAEFENTQVHKNGRHLIIKTSGLPFFDTRGNLAGWRGIDRDITLQRKSEEKLRQSEEKFRSFVELTSDWVWEMNAQGIFTYVDPSIKNFIGYEAEEVIGKKMSDLMPPELGKRARHFLNKYNELRKPLPVVELTHLHKDGTEVVCETTGVPTFDTEGNLTGWRGLNKDITERVHMERTIRESEEKFRSLIEASSDWIWEINDQGIFTFVDPKVKDFIGYNSGEVIGKSVTEFMIPEESRRARDLISKYNELKKPFSSDVITHIHKDGREVVVETSGIPLFDEHGNLTGWQGLNRDITERKLAEDKIRESEEKFRSLVETSSDWVFEIDQNGIFTYADPKVKDFLGYDQEEIIGKSFESFMPEEEAKRIGQYFQKTRGLRKPIRILRITELHKEGKPVEIETSALPIIDDSGNLLGWRGVNRDITEKVKAEEELRKYRDHLEELVKQRTAQLEAANKELEAFAYSVSHDLRAPLRAIDGFSHALLEDYADKLDEEGKEYLNRVRTASQRMGRLIDDILKLSRLTRTEMHYERVNLSTLAMTIARELQSGEPERNVEFIIAPDLAVQGDRQLLQVALANLLTNAWKFTTGRDPAQIELGVEKMEGKTAFFVRDNGVGFDMAYADKLFGAFQRLHSVKDFPGTGIGLATVQKIIHRHGGDVWAKGVVGQGATFYFTV